MKSHQPADRRLSPSRLLLFGLVLSLGLSESLPAGPKNDRPSPPNVVVFLADDAGWGDYGHTGNSMVATPAIDSLARDGVTFDRFFVCPVCSPTRSEFLTGRYYQRTGVTGVSVGQERLNLSETTFVQALRRAGYATGIFGKWHNGSQWPYHPLARGFEEFTGYTAGHWGEYQDPPLERNGHPIRTQGYIVDVCTDAALDFIDRHHERPFFCYVPFTTPHSPWSVPQADWDRWKDRPIALRGPNPAQENLDETRCVLAMMENLDRNVGRVLQRLEERQVTNNTIVVYFSDNGPNTGRWTGGMKGRKGSTDEGGIRTTCLWRWPGQFAAGRKVPEIAGAIDFLPTLLTLTGVPRVGDQPLDGRDLSPLLRGTGTPWPDRTLFSTWGGKSSARTQRFRLDSQGQLFEMLTDPGQSMPVNSQHPEVVAALQSQLDSWKREMQSAVDHGDGPRRTAGRKGVDPRPIPVGYREFPRTWLPARDGAPFGKIQRSSAAPNSSYFQNWSALDDRIEWDLEVATAGQYAVSLEYTCRDSDVGSTIAMTFQSDQTSAGLARLEGKVHPAWDPPLHANQDTLPRPPGESKLKPFQRLELGTIALPQGRGPLVLRATEIAGTEVMHLFSVTLTLLPE